MHQRDYLLRLIEEMTRMIGQALGLREKKKREQLIVEWDELLQRRFRMSGELADKLQAEDIMRLFRTGERLHADEIQALAIVLYERAKLEWERSRNNEAALPYGATEVPRYGESTLEAGTEETLYIRRLMKSYELLIEATAHGSDRRLLPVQEAMDSIYQAIKGYHIDDRLREKMWRWFEREGRLADAEDSLFIWLRRAEMHQPEQVVNRCAQALQFYERLDAMSDELLLEGGLSREEIHTGIEDISKITALHMER
ncbi:DUF6483 family protein [Paenibacillus alvei]|uniref:DUF6483 family protein n=1 Tax=Paenibacillus TaxID=44249 RepID=UPI000287D735|nr:MULTISPECIES: DUF6483 family protein [Paenibacillus]EJW19207.1 hypothetical protein PAV_1c01780 [Paenibacillus alvei DSM 29]MCY7483592.1 DUF6483 family protein [Paenibacillus alvei]MCY9542651.1 DUF6483 family protein [Paenibacillus alvei]MCY9704921.1 DUF6483 family protein [Paenibacillus alvei]MCY9735802.1 DUF6483 family protein [Paenibacillus alvei]